MFAFSFLNGKTSDHMTIISHTKIFVIVFFRLTETVRKKGPPGLPAPNVYATDVMVAKMTSPAVRARPRESYIGLGFYLFIYEEKMIQKLPLFFFFT